MLMRINTLGRKKILFIYLLLAFLGFTFHSFAQCPTVSNTSQSFCDVESPTVGNLAATSNGNGVVWYATAVSTTPLSNASGLINGEDYFADDNSGICGTRQRVVVTIFAAPIGLSFQGVCVDVASNATLANLIVTGNSIKWYDVATNGTALPLSTVLVDNTIYYASQTNPSTNCETSRLSVFVNVGVVPVPTGDPTQDFCNIPGNPPTVGNLVATGNLRWYSTISSASPLALSVPLVNGQSYFATTVDPPCESVTRFQVDVTLLEPNDAGTSAIKRICVSDIPSFPPFNLFNELTGTPDTTGTWSGPLPTSNGHLGTVNIATLTLAGSPYVFTYSVSSSVCVTSTSTVTIIILPLPTATIAANTTICSGASATITFTGTANATVTYTINGGGSQTIGLNGSGTATIINTFAATTVFNLVSIASSGTPSCSQILSGSATITVLPPPTVTISSNVSICSGSSATVTFTGTPNATVTYTVNGGGNQTIILNAAGSATITNTYVATTTFTLVSIASATVPICSRAQTGSMIITVIPPPTVTIASSVSICPNGSATVTFTGTPNATVTYTINSGGSQTILLNGAGTASITNTYATTTVFNLVSIATGTVPVCSQPQTGTVTITVLPLPTVTIAANTTICSGTSATVTFTGTANATVTYTINGGGNQSIILNGTGTATLINTYSTTTTIALVSVASAGTPSCSQPQTGSVIITVIPPPTVTIASNVSICPNSSATVTFTGTPNATVTYTINGGGSQTILLNGTGSASITNTYATTTVFNLVSIASGTVPVCTQPLSGSVTVTVIPLPTVTIASSVSICPNGSATVTFTGTPNATVTYTINSGSNQTILLNGTGTASITNTYAVTTVFTLVSVATSGTPSCSQPQTGTVTITVVPLPMVTIAANSDICIGGSATVTFTGTPNATVTYTINGGGSQTILLNVTGTASITNTYAATTIFTLVSVASAGVPSCSQPQTGTVTITVVPPPTVTMTSNQTICANSSATVTFTGTPNAIVTYTIGSGGNQTITLSASGTATIINTYSLTTVFNLVSVSTVGTPGCIVPVTGTVTITVLQLPSVAINASQTICSGASATVNFTGTPNAIVTYTINSGGNLTTTLNGAGTATITNTYTADTVFTLVNISLPGTPSCTQPLTGTIIITVLPLPTATMAANQTICSGDTATVTFTGTPNATVTYTINSGGNLTTTLTGTGTATITNTYSATTVFNLVSVSTTGSPGCTQPLTGTVTITVIPPPTVTISSSQTICTGSSATVTFTGTPNATVTYTVNSGGNQTITLDASGTATITNTYSATTVYTLVDVTTTGTPTCTQPQTGTITITVVDLPIVTIASSSIICSGENATVTFTGTPNAIVTYTINSGGNLTIPLDATGIATLTNTYSADAIFDLVSVATVGTPSCSQPQTGSVTITVLPSPVVAITADATICAGSSATVTFTGTPNATITYTINSGSDQTIVLDNSGIATIANTYSTTTVFNLVSITSAGTPSCTRPQTGTVTITVIPLPVVTLSPNTTICFGTSATVTFTGTPNATVTYTINSGGNLNITLDATGTATITNTYNTTTIFTLVDAILTGTPTCSQPQSGTMTITVDPVPTVTISGSTTICANSSTSVTFTGTPNATVTFTDGGTSHTIVLNASGSAVYTNSYAATTTISLVSITTSGTPGCSQPQTGDVIITVAPLPTASISAPSSVCMGANGTVTFTGTPDATVNYTVNSSGNQSIVLDASGLASVTSPLSVTSTYTIVSVVSSGSPICTNPLTSSLTITINPLPTVTISSSGTVCSGTNAAVTFTGTPNSTVTYTIDSGSNQTIVIGASGVAVLNTSLSATTIYCLVSITLNNPPSCSQAQTGCTTITVTQPPIAGSNGAVTLCSTASPQDLFLLLGSSAQPGGTWSPVLSSGTGIYNPAVDPAGNYVYTVAGTPPCVNDTSLVTVTIVPAANAGVDGIANLCSNVDPIDLITFLTGTPQAGGTWSPALISGTGIFDPSSDLAGVYTYAVNGVSPCLGDTATVTVNITPGPNAGISGTATLCLNSPAQDLFLSLGGTPQAGGTWSPAMASGTGFFDPTVDTAGVYTYTFSGNQPCDDDTATVTVIVNPLPDAGDDSIANICSNSDPRDLLTYLGGTPQNGGVWTPALASGTNFFNPAVDLAGIYTYTVGNPFCTPDSAQLTVNIIPGPDAGLDGAITFCISDASQDLFLSLNGTPVAGGTWSPALASGSGIFNPALDTDGDYTYTLAGNQPCDNDTAIVTVTVNPLANAGTFTGNQEVCTSLGTFDLFTLLNGNQSGGIWTDSASATVTNLIDISTFASNTYSYTYTVSNNCGPDDQETVQFTVLPNPILEAANIAISSPNCKGDNVVVTFSGMTDGTYTLNYDLSLSNVLPGQVATVIISGGTGTFNINAADIPNVGTTRITFLIITNANTTCVTAINPNVSADFILRPSSDLVNSNLSITNVCYGTDLVVTIAGATGLADGNYQFIFSMPQASTMTGTTAVVAVAGGAGLFTIPASYFTTAGNYTFTITSITNLSSGCNNLTEDATTSFEIYPIPSLTGAIMNAGSACLNLSNEVTLSNATLTDGNYTITYDLTGASTATNVAAVTFTGGIAIITVPGADLNTVGNVIITITQIVSQVGSCSGSGAGLAAIFEVSQLDTPVLLPKGNEFCGTDNPTIASLSNNISGTNTVIWYNAASGGTAYSNSDLLVDATIYYAAYVSASGCESITRLPVTTDLNHCAIDDIVIPDGFSPNNGDLINGTFEIKNLVEKYPKFKLEIYNRYGNILYKGDINTPRWDGTTSVGGVNIGNKEVPVGVYFYILYFNDGIRNAKQGRLYLSR